MPAGGTNELWWVAVAGAPTYVWDEHETTWFDLCIRSYCIMKVKDKIYNR